MKSILTIFLSIFLVLGFTNLGIAGEKVDAEITVGGTTTSGDEYVGSFSEYDSTTDSNSWVLGGTLSYPGDKYRVGIQGDFQDDDSMAFSGNVDLNRIFQIESEYIRFLHRLDHDNLDHMIATLALSSQGATLYHTDFNPDDTYGITRSTWKNHAKLNIPSIPGLVLTFDNKWDQRKGMEQARTMSKCSSCHVVGKSKDIDEVTQEFSPAISYRFGMFEIEYKFLYRTYTDGGDDPSNLYFQSQHPGTGGNPDFAQRMQFDNGEFAFSRNPSSTKWSHKVKTKATMPNSAVNLGFVYSEATNMDSDSGESALTGNVGDELSVDYWAVNGGWHWRLNKQVGLTIKGKYQEQEADEVFVDVNDQIIVAGRPGAGDTYANFLGTTFDYNRESAYDKEKWIADTKLTWRLSKKLKLKFGYNIEYEDRESAHFYHVTEDTTTHKFSIGSKWKPIRKVKVDADYRYTYVDNPYVFHHALCPDFDAAVAAGYIPGTYSPTSYYSEYVYGMRTASASNKPGQVHEVKLKTNWNATTKLNTNLYLKYKYAVNSDVDINDWSQNMVNSGFGFTYNLTNKTGINAGYNFFYDKYDATFCSAYYHG